jgi:hypothetical protein
VQNPARICTSVVARKLHFWADFGLFSYAQPLQGPGADVLLQCETGGAKKEGLKK